jgi:hypothetical protein
MVRIEFDLSLSNRGQSVSAMDNKDNDAAATARAFVIYSLVPYLGILFSPGAVVLSGVGLIKSYRDQERVARSAACITLILGTLILIGQLLLWWILYKVPEWATQA